MLKLKLMMVIRRCAKWEEACCVENAEDDQRLQMCTMMLMRTGKPTTSISTIEGDNVTSMFWRIRRRRRREEVSRSVETGHNMAMVIPLMIASTMTLASRQ